jgi:hypothetical protein
MDDEEARQAVSQAQPLSEIVRQAIYAKHLEADRLLQKNDFDTRTISLTNKWGVGPAAQFSAAVLAEYRMIRPKVINRNNPEFNKLMVLDPFLFARGDREDLKMFIDAHLRIGRFLELNGITRYERAYHPVGSIIASG